jgi:YfiH family protein
MSKVLSTNLSQGTFETWTSKPETDFAHVTQVHGTEIVSIETLPTEADGISSSWKDLSRPMAIKTADCLPIVIEGEKGVVFLHAGWRGLANGILARDELSLINPLQAFIGPSIHVCCFEVTEDFRENFKGSAYFKNKDSKLFFDLQLEARSRLHQLYPQIKVSISPFCTSCEEKFHSFRRDKTKNRNWNLYIKG